VWAGAFAVPRWRSRGKTGRRYSYSQKEARDVELKEGILDDQYVDIVLSPEDWIRVAKRLSVYAKTLISGGVVTGLGIDEEDLVHETLRRLWDPATGVKWRADKGPPAVQAVVGYLKVVLRNHFFDCLRKGAHTHTAPDPTPVTDCDGSETDAPAQVGTPSAEERLVERILVDQLYRRARSLAEAEDDVEVVFYLDLQVKGGGPYPNAEAATHLGLTAADIVNIKKRLGRLHARTGQPTVAARARK